MIPRFWGAHHVIPYLMRFNPLDHHSPIGARTGQQLECKFSMGFRDTSSDSMHSKYVCFICLVTQERKLK